MDINNGLIIQWITITAADTPTINLPIVMSNNNYTGLTCYQNAPGGPLVSIENVAVMDKQINTCKIRIASSTYTKCVFIIGF